MSTILCAREFSGGNVGLLVDGRWQDQWYETKAHGGRFVRPASNFRAWVTADGSSDYPADAGRYHLYDSLACPWAHRTVIFRKLKRLEDVIGMTEVEPIMGDYGWQFGPDADRDTVSGKSALGEVYLIADARYTGRW